MEAGEKSANVCSPVGLAPATVSTIMAKAENVNHSAQKITTLHASNISHARNINIEKNGKIINTMG